MSGHRGVFVAWIFIAASAGPLHAGHEPKYGGVLNAMPREELSAGFAIHERTARSVLPAYERQ